MISIYECPINHKQMQFWSKFLQINDREINQKIHLKLKKQIIK